MPWTFAHPAAVLPLLRLTGPGKLSFAALVIGSMSPDFGYYLGLFELAGLAHTLQGLFLLCLPSGLLVLLFSRWLRAPVAELFPQPHRAALLAAKDERDRVGIRSVGLAAASLVIGAGTHILWDSFTHDGRYFVNHLHVLQTPLFIAFNREFRVFNLVQHGSTLVGCAFLVLVYYRHASRFSAFRTDDAGELRRYALLAGVSVAASLCALPFSARDAMHAGPQLFFSVLLVRQLIYTTTASFLLLSVLALWRRAQRPH